jgi:hypothetical protein
MRRRTSSEWCGMSRRSFPPDSPSTRLAQVRATPLSRSRRAKGSLGSSAASGATRTVSTAVFQAARFSGHACIFMRGGRHKLSAGGIAASIGNAMRIPRWSCRGSGLGKAVAAKISCGPPPPGFQKKKSRTACRCSL